MALKTPLYDTHVALGAKMVDFAGFDMPVQYSSIKEEHLNVRENVGVFDVSHMGEFVVEGPEALDLVQAVSSNDASKMVVGQAQYSCLPNDNGGIVDDFLIYKMADDRYLLVVNASNIDKDFNWISSKNTFDCTLENHSDQYGLLAIQGPNAAKAMASLCTNDLDNIKYYHFEVGTFAGVENVIISGTGYTGSGGFELYVPAADTITVWNKLFEAGQEFGMIPTGLGARDTLRLEKGFCLYGNDIDDTTSPIEAGLSWITKTKKKADFPSKALFAAHKKSGTTKSLVGFKVLDRRVARHGYKIQNKDGQVIGEVTSGTLSPSLDIPIGMGYVSKENKAIGTTIYIDTGRKLLEGLTVKMPFL